MELQTHGHLLTVHRAKPERKKRKINWTMLILVLPAVAWMIFSFGVPQMFMLFLSFMTQGEYGGVVYHFTWMNYAQMFQSSFMTVLWHSVEFALVITVLSLLVGYPFSYVIASSSRKRRMMLLFLVIVPFWISQLIRTFAMMFMINTSGLINVVLLKLHLIAQPLNILYTPFAVYLGQFYNMLPYMILPLYASIQSHLDHPELLEAAYDMGATHTKAFWRVTVPLTTSGIAVGTLLVFIPALASYFIPLLMSGGTYELEGNFIAQQFLANDNWPYGSASSVGVIFVTLILILILMRFMKNAFMEEA